MKKIILVFYFSFLIPYFSLSQNIGIGTITPTRARLELHGAVGATSAIFGGESSGISLQRNWPGIGFNQYFNGGYRYMANGFAAVQNLDPGNGLMSFDIFPNGIANTIASTFKRGLIISKEGWVNIGSGDYPVASLTVARGTAVNGTAVFRGSTYASHFNYAGTEDTYIRGGINASNVFINDIPNGRIFLGNGSARVGVNSGNPVLALEVVQTLDGTGIGLINPHSWNVWEMINALNFGFWFNGSVKGSIRYSDGEYNALSDERVKTNIKQLSPVLDKLIKLHASVYEMKYNNPNREKSIGFIAQEVKEYFPELVTIYNDTTRHHGYKDITDLHMMNYSGFGVLAIKAIQEQQVIIENQQKQINALFSRMEALEKSGRRE